MTVYFYSISRIWCEWDIYFRGDGQCLWIVHPRLSILFSLAFICNFSIFTVCLEFGMNGVFILEEDGTEIENNEVLYRFNDKTLMVLGKHEKWQNSRSRLQKNGERYLLICGQRQIKCGLVWTYGA